MIYQLMKMDHAWKMSRLIIPIYAILAILSTHSAASYFPAVFREATDSEFSGITFFLTFFPVMVCGPYLRTYPYLLALPISTRTLYFSRTLSIIALLWSPSILSTIIFACMSPAAMINAHRLLMISGINTFIVFLIQTIRPKAYSAPLGALALIMIDSLWMGLAIILPVLSILRLSLGGSALLFWWNWQHLPSSFEHAPISQAGKHTPIPYSEPHSKAISTGISLSTLKPVLRAIFSLPYSFMLLILILEASGGFIVAIPMFILFIWSYTRFRMRWLSTLPLPSGLVLFLICMPIFISLTVGSLLSSFTIMAPYSLRLRILYLSTCFGTALLSILSAQLFHWRKFGPLPDLLRIFAGFSIPLLFSIVFTYLSIFQLGTSSFESMLRFFSQAMPKNLFFMSLLRACPKIGNNDKHGA